MGVFLIHKDRNKPDESTLNGKYQILEERYNEIMEKESDYNRSNKNSIYGLEHIIQNYEERENSNDDKPNENDKAARDNAIKLLKEIKDLEGNN